MVVLGVCAGCRAEGPVTVVAFGGVTSTVILEQQAYASRLFCVKCAQRQYASARSNAFFLSFLPGGHVLALLTGAQQKRELGRVKGGFAGAESVADAGTTAEEDREILALLPWAGLLGRRVYAGGNIMVTPALMVGIAAVIGMVLCVVGIVSTLHTEHMDPASLAAARRMCGEGAGALAALAAGAFVWEWQSLRRKDPARDVLAEIFPEGAIHDIGRADMCLVANSAEGRVRLLVGLQNRYDTAATVKLALNDAGQKESVELSLEGSEVAIWIAETACNSAEDGRCRLSAGARASGSGGRKVRRGRRRRLRDFSQTVVWKGNDMSGAAPADWWGFMGPEGILRVPVGNAAPGVFAPQWRRVGVWSAQQETPVSYAASVAIAFARGAGEGY